MLPDAVFQRDEKKDTNFSWSELSFDDSNIWKNNEFTVEVSLKICISWLYIFTLSWFPLSFEMLCHITSCIFQRMFRRTHVLKISEDSLKNVFVKFFLSSLSCESTTYIYTENWLHRKCLWVFPEFLNLLLECHVVKPIIK